MNVLEVHDLRKTFGGFHAVDGVSFNVEKGSIHAVIGPNGAGKTTLFNLVSGHLRPTTGKVSFDGADITGKTPDVLARMGMTRAFQITTIFPKLSVLDSVECSVNARKRQAASLWPWRRQAARDEALKLLEAVGLAEFRDEIANTLSHGDQRTLEVALALATEPRLLLLDEPTAGMSPFETRHMVALVQDLARSRGVTVLFCEHDIGTVFSISDRVTVMHRGQVIADGAPEVVRKDQHVIDVYIGKQDYGSKVQGGGLKK
ncbi:MAG: ABC transporter ATP-binding protein [Burkholderiaceae bacterium]|jgi:branched-chain amino acid transport system ATP-binding protein|nr:MAG: ABC transporter ATP-binding protein [Burkholderiaceae bacterium]